MSARKIVVVESEKSPKVVSTNWKEDVVLQKNMHILDRSQKTVINRIIVEQKILNKRFQTKLSRSKMAWARTTNNVDMQKRLRDRTTFVLNTNVGNKESDDAILQIVWDKGRRTYERRLENDVYRKKPIIGAFTAIDDDSPIERTPKKDPNVPDKTYMGLNLRPDTAITIQKYPVQRRPATSFAEVRTKSIETPPEPAEVGSIEGAVDGDTKIARPQTAFVTSVTADDGKDIKKKRRPSTATGGFLKTVSDMMDPAKTNNNKTTPKASTPKPTPQSARPAGARHTTGKAGLGSMFDDNEFQISLLDFQRFRVYSADYESRVKRFGEKMKPLQQDTHIDYYTAKLQSDLAKHQGRFQMEAARDATEEDIKRATGDLSVRSLTLRAPTSVISMQNV